MKTISVIVPVYNEESNISVLYSRLQNVAVNAPYDFEFIFVDDGSIDHTFSILGELAARDRRVKVLKLSRNFGSHAACLAGLKYARGDACSFISADLQDPPELVLVLAGKWENGFDVVIGVREWDTASFRLFPKIYWKLVRRFALKNTPETGTDAFLIDRKVVDAVVSIGEKNTSIFGLILWSGFDQTIVSYKKGERTRGVSKWTLARKIKLFIDTFVSFSYFPLRVISILGIVTAFTGFVYALIVIAARLFYFKTIEGWSSLMVVLLLVSGVQMIMLGVLGEYLWRNFDESRKRPPFIVKNVLGFEEKKEK
jgi:glycosyltransferase involved in cell wall biosynthesis